MRRDECMCGARHGVESHEDMCPFVLIGRDQYDPARRARWYKERQAKEKARDKARGEAKGATNG